MVRRATTVDVLRDFRHWAQVSGQLRCVATDARATTLQHYGLTPAQWDHADAYWRAVLIEDVAAGEDGRAHHYYRVCQQVQHAAATPAPTDFRADVMNGVPGPASGRS